MFLLRPCTVIIRPLLVLSCLTFITSTPLLMRVLCVAEKPSIARAVSQILSGGRVETVSESDRRLIATSNALSSVQHRTALSKILTLITPKQTLASRSPLYRVISSLTTSLMLTVSGTLVILSPSSMPLYTPSYQARTKPQNAT